MRELLPSSQSTSQMSYHRWPASWILMFISGFQGNLAESPDDDQLCGTQSSPGMHISDNGLPYQVCSLSFHLFVPWRQSALPCQDCRIWSAKARVHTPHRAAFIGTCGATSCRSTSVPPCSPRPGYMVAHQHKPSLPSLPVLHGCRSFVNRIQDDVHTSHLCVLLPHRTM